MKTPKQPISSRRHPRLVRLLTWLTGRKPDNTRKDWKQGDAVCLKRYPAAMWEYAPTGDYFSITIQVVAAPNAIHRGFQRLAFGVRYRLLPNPHNPRRESGESNSRKSMNTQSETTQKSVDVTHLVRPFRLLRKGPKAWQKLPHSMPFGRATLPKLCTITATDRFELTKFERLAMEDANGTAFMLTFLDLPNGPFAPPRYQAWKLAKSSKRRTNAEHKRG